MRTGRPTKLTAEVQRRICEALALGLSREMAGDYAGVCRDSITRWTKRGERETKGIYFDFVCALKEAEPKREARWLAVIERATLGIFVDVVEEKLDEEGNVTSRTTTKKMVQAPQWTAAAWKLERPNPDRYRLAPAALVQNTVTAQGSVATLVQQVRNMSDEDIHKRLAELQAGHAALLAEPQREA